MKKVTIASVIALSLLAGCASSSNNTGSVPLAMMESGHETNRVLRDEGLPGTALMTWEEPMVDHIEVPPSLDPEGHYYRPAHREVVEVRQGRWQPVAKD